MCQICEGFDLTNYNYFTLHVLYIICTFEVT